MVEYTHELRWKIRNGTLKKAEYFYNINNKTLYRSEDGSIVDANWDSEFKRFVEKQNPDYGWQIFELNICLENK